MRIEKMKKYGLPMIKPCPFCGGYATITERSKTYIKGELTYITYCYCTDCDSRGRRVILKEEGRSEVESYKIAISHWNRRI